MVDFMLKDFIDWDVMMALERYAGSHTRNLSGLFLHSQVIAEATEGDYSGSDGMVYLFTPPNPGAPAKIVLLSDYFGSCSGCDSWEDATDKDFKALMIAIANNARMFDSIEECIEYLESGDKGYEFEDLSDDLIKELKEVKIKV